MFENITKGVWSIDEYESKVNKFGVTKVSLRVDNIGQISTINNVICYEPDGSTENAEFIAYCFNLQQKYDISKLEEAVKAIESLRSEIFTFHSQYAFKRNAMDHSAALRESEQLLTQIKR